MISQDSQKGANNFSRSEESEGSDAVSVFSVKTDEISVIEFICEAEGINQPAIRPPEKAPARRKSERKMIRMVLPV
jgi:hypothetical protein